ncbi:hypothetical protein FOA52_000195 [Chlamydomonas sp. UWO 241]|nr:hypothetical protein FOA52_000195 [Chlamydomonas sp. UWO 241]
MHASLLAKVTASRPVSLSISECQAPPYAPPLGTAELLARRAAVVARLDAKATEYRDAAVRDGSMKRLMPQQAAIAGKLELAAYARTDMVVGVHELIEVPDLWDEGNTVDMESSVAPKCPI